AATRGLVPALRGVKPAGLPYSPWQLLEHLRIAQADILEFCRNPEYRELSWPADYWPAAPAPQSEEEWEGSIAAFLADRAELATLAAEADLFAEIPHGSGQTYLRELLLVTDHTSYHVGEMVAVRRMLGAWPPS
ncbi:MAG TPA: DinB family protein, partial [Longimicrobium sp.]|nr:DinB family protein [Longimicrobium sp.]